VPLDLGPQQVKQAEMQKISADGAMTARLPETYQWLLVPTQSSAPQAPIGWEAIRLSGQDALAVRASKKLRSDEHLLISFAASRLRMELDKIPLWRGNHVAVRQLVEDFARYLYLPRLKNPSVLADAIQDGFSLLTWEQDSFAAAESFDGGAGRYRSLRAGQHVSIDADSASLLVKSAVARKQLDKERNELAAGSPPSGASTVLAGVEGTAQVPGDSPSEMSGLAPKTIQPKRFHGTVTLDMTRVGRDASRIADEVIAHLSSLVGARVTVTLEVEATMPAGASDQVVRTVTENARTLKFTSQGFEKE
jgi:hypothetical protein